MAGNIVLARRRCCNLPSSSDQRGRPETEPGSLIAFELDAERYQMGLLGSVLSREAVDVLKHV